MGKQKINGRTGKALSSTPHRRNSCRLVGPFRRPDGDAVRRFMHEYRVPLLAEEFLRDAAGSPNNTVQQQVNFQTPMQEVGQTDREGD